MRKQPTAEFGRRISEPSFCQHVNQSPACHSGKLRAEHDPKSSILTGTSLRRSLEDAHWNRGRTSRLVTRDRKRALSKRLASASIPAEVGQLCTRCPSALSKMPQIWRSTRGPKVEIHQCEKRCNDLFERMMTRIWICHVEAMALPGQVANGGSALRAARMIRNVQKRRLYCLRTCPKHRVMHEALRTLSVVKIPWRSNP